MDKTEVLRYLGHTGQAYDEQMADELERAIEQVSQLSGHVTYKVFDFTKAQDIHVDQTLLDLTGNSIKHILSQSDKLLIFAATLGSELDQLIHKSQYKSALTSMFLDAAANVRIEEILDDMCLQIPYYQTPRFSPGYGDLPLELQHLIIQVLDAGKIGLSVTASSLLIPKKSVTGIIGLSDKEMNVTYRFCDDCLKRTSCDFKICSREKS